MKPMIAWMFLLSAGLLLFTGCARISHHATFPTNKPISFSQRLDRSYVYQKSFIAFEHQVYFFLHWFRINHVNGIEMAERQLKNADGIVNLRIRTAYDPLDLLITVATAGLITTYHVIATGDLVMIPPPPVSGMPGPAPTAAPIQ